jgi:hypothetical protein
MLHKSMRGKDVDMGKLMRANELTPAIGNAKVNARGDKLGPNGQIIQTRDEVVSSYYESAPKTKPAKVNFIPTQPVVVPEIKSADTAPEVVKPTKKEE